MTTNSTEWGIFNDEGCIEASMWSEKEAQTELAKYYIDGERGLTVSEICPDHEEQMQGACDICDTEDDDECEGHPAGEFDPMGVTVYCDGTCRYQ